MMLSAAVFLALSIRSDNNICHAFQLTASTKEHNKQNSSSKSSPLPSRLFSSVEEDDFFFRASRQAAKDRYEKLKSGEDPFGLFGGSSNNDIDAPANDTHQNEMVTLSPSTDIASDSPIKSSEVEKKDSNVISDSQYSELLSNISQPAKSAVQSIKMDDTTEISQDEYIFHKKMMETRFAMGTKETTSTSPDTAESVELKRKSRIEAAEKAKMTSESTKIEEISSASVITEIKSEVTSGGPGCIRKCDHTAAPTKVTYRNRDELLNALYPEKVGVLEPSMEGVTKTSIGPKENLQLPIVESTDTTTEAETPEVNEENVAVGLMVLTKSFFTLKQILDNKKN